LKVLGNPIYRFKRIGLEAGPLSQWLLPKEPGDMAQHECLCTSKVAAWMLDRGTKKVEVAVGGRPTLNSVGMIAARFDCGLTVSLRKWGLSKVQSVDQRMRLGMRCRLSLTADVPSHTSGAAMRH
jgi:hypothetical protein